jgi:hypothetical protein
MESNPKEEHETIHNTFQIWKKRRRKRKRGIKKRKRGFVLPHDIQAPKPKSSASFPSGKENKMDRTGIEETEKEKNLVHYHNHITRNIDSIFYF